LNVDWRKIVFHEFFATTMRCQHIMNTVTILFLAALLVLFLVYVLFPEKKDSRPSSGRVKETAKGKTDKQAAPPPPLTQSSEVQGRTFLESYPGLADIAQLPVAEGWVLTATEDVDHRVIQTVKERISIIKPMPVSYLKLMNLLRNPESNPGEITSLTTTHPVFSARILRAVNSAYFNRPEKVMSVGRAITLLGYNSVRALVLQETLHAVVPEERRGDRETYNKTWAHSAVVSACAGYLAKNVFRLSEYELATMGLLHDLGKYFIHMLEPRTDAVSEAPLVLREEWRYGINHASLGSLIANSWQLSESIVKCIEYHHHPAFSPVASIPKHSVQPCFVVCLSDLICKSLGYCADDTDRLQIRPEYYELFQLQPDLQDVVTPRLLKEIEKTHNTVQSYITEA
jgi:HD-like signal output (HDOD) protein